MTLGTYACCARPVLPHKRHCPVCHALYAMAEEGHVCPGEALRQAWARHRDHRGHGWSAEDEERLERHLDEFDTLCAQMHTKEHRDHAALRVLEASAVGTGLEAALRALGAVVREGEAYG